MVSFLGKAVILFPKNKLGGTFCIPFKVYAHKLGAGQRTSRELRHPSVMLTLTNTDPVPPVCQGPQTTKPSSIVQGAGYFTESETRVNRVQVAHSICAFFPYSLYGFRHLCQVTWSSRAFPTVP